MHISYVSFSNLFHVLCNNQCSVINAESSVDNKERREEIKQQIQDNQLNFVTDNVDNSK